MRVYEVMSKAVETIKPNVAGSEAKTRMQQKKIHHLVVTEGAKLQGIISDRDLGGPKLSRGLGKSTVSDLMTSPVLTVTTRTLVRRAARAIGRLAGRDGRQRQSRRHCHRVGLAGTARAQARAQVQPRSSQGARPGSMDRSR